MSALAAPRPLPVTQEALDALDRAHEELARKLREHGITYEQLCEEALEIRRRIRGESPSPGNH